jgi:hypothetical protein
MLELAAPGVEDGHAADLGAEMLGVAGDIEKALRDGAKARQSVAGRTHRATRLKRPPESNKINL